MFLYQLQQPAQDLHPAGTFVECLAVINNMAKYSTKVPTPVTLREIAKTPAKLNNKAAVLNT